MKQVLFVDSLNKLNIRKDSSLLMGLTLKDLGVETYLLFEEDFYYSNHGDLSFRLYPFQGRFKEGSFYIEDFELGEAKMISMERGDTIHMRIDPPFDARYQRFLWMLSSISNGGIHVSNNPAGISKYNEKLRAYESTSSLPSFVGSSVSALRRFLEELKLGGEDALILKPLDLYQGIGVEKMDMAVGIDTICSRFVEKCKETKGAIVVQPFDHSVTSGEIRTIFYRGHELGTILKTPPKGAFLANIASGATYEAFNLNELQRSACHEVAVELAKEGVDLVAFDVLGDNLSEVNITCPGLMVEVSEALGKNIAKEMFSYSGI